MFRQSQGSLLPRNGARSTHLQAAGHLLTVQLGAGLAFVPFVVEMPVQGMVTALATQRALASGAGQVSGREHCAAFASYQLLSSQQVLTREV